MTSSTTTPASIHVGLGGTLLTVPAGTRLSELLPAEIDGEPVVAGLMERKAVSLDTALHGDVTVAALTLADREGRHVYQRSLALVFLEAAHRGFPELAVQIGAPSRYAQGIILEGVEAAAYPAIAERLNAEMRAIIESATPFKREFWLMEEANARFAEQGWSDVVELLRTWRSATVAVVTVGAIHALAMGPHLAHTGQLSRYRLEPHAEGLRLSFWSASEDAPEIGRDEAPRDVPRDVPQERWLKAMGVHSVGSFNGYCLAERVSQLIRAVEGYHEKRISQIADAIKARGDRLRVIGIAGPSSSGKTTFIKRLTVQLQIDAINPISLSLDDYFLDRERNPRLSTGEFDFESITALDLPLLHDHLRRLIAGERVKTAHFDFKAGKSDPEGGPELQLGPGDMLLIEGIHGLNPRLLGSAVAPDEAFRIFIYPRTTLPLDCLTHFSAADLRLLRRIVRDRHSRGLTAAENIALWEAVRAGEDRNIFPFLDDADEVFDSALIYEPAVLKIYAERYLLEVPSTHPSYTTAYRLRQLLDRFIAIYPDHVPPTSILREFIGGSGFEY